MEAAARLETNAATTDLSTTSKHMPPGAERTRAEDQGWKVPAADHMRGSSKNSTCKQRPLPRRVLEGTCCLVSSVNPLTEDADHMRGWTEDAVFRRG